MLTPAQQSAKTIFTTADGPDYTFNEETHGIDEFYSLGNDSACIAYMNDLAVGIAQSKAVPRASIPGTDIIAAVGDSEDFAGMDGTTLGKLQWLVQKEPAPIGNAKFASGIEKALEAYDAAKAAFVALKNRPGTIWESLTQTDGAHFTQTDLTAIRAS